MRPYHIIPTVLALICLLGHSGLGAPTIGRYMWMECSPRNNHPNCVVKKGPWITLAGQNTHLPPIAAKDIVAVSSEEAAVELEEQSGESSGDPDTFAPILSMKDYRSMRKFMQQELNKNEEEGSTFELIEGIDYSEYVKPQKAALSKKDMTEDLILA